MNFLYYCFIVFIFTASVAISQDFVLADFENLQENTFPEGWGIKKGLWYTTDKNNKTWTVKQEANNKFLSANSYNDSFTIGKKGAYSLKKFGFLKWKWRVNKFPTGADESVKTKNDSPAGLYVVFSGFAVPYTIKYVWSTTKTVGEVFESPYSSKTKIIVIRTGTSEINKWVEEKRNVLEDYKKVFNKSDIDREVEGIALLTDSDDTKSEASADYDTITATTE